MPSQPLRLGFDTDLTIRNAAAVKAILVEHFPGSPNLSLVLNPEAAVDLSFVQLVSAARNSGSALALAEPAGPVLRDLLARAGFIAGAPVEDLKFWLHSENAQ